MKHKAIGQKYDEGKLDYTLLPWDSIEKVVEVLMKGAEKYDREGWKSTPDAVRKYTAAMQRHLVAYMKGTINDTEDNLHHIAHAVCDGLFILYFDNKKTVAKTIAELDKGGR